jgi:hypothetical protein
VAPPLWSCPVLGAAAEVGASHSEAAKIDYVK